MVREVGETAADAVNGAMVSAELLQAQGVKAFLVQRHCVQSVRRSV